MKRTPFVITITLAILALAHVALYFALASIFPDPSLKVVFAIAPGILTLGFIGIMISSRKYNNLATRIAYPILGIWLAMFMYLLMTSFLYGIAFLIFSPHTAMVIGIVLMLATLLAIMYGIYNAATIRTTHHTVRLPNLPTAWKGKTAVFFSDIHLGQVYSAWFSRKIAEHINSLKPEIVLIGGDLYDGAALNPVTAVAPLADIKAPRGTYYITGNHEQINGPSRYLHAIHNLGIHILMNEVVTLDGLQIAGADYKTTATRAGYEAIMKKLPLDTSKPSIFMKHVPDNLDIAEHKGVSLHLSGHTHQGQLFPMSLATKAVYKGYDYGMKKFGTMQTITSSGIGGWGPPVRVGTKSEILLITFE